MIAEGTPEDVARTPGSHTGHFLAGVLAGREVPVGAVEPSLLDVDTAPVKKSGRKRTTAAARTTPAQPAATVPTAKKTAAKKTAAKKTTAKKAAVQQVVAQTPTRQRTPRTPKY